ncbi:hypothetical protein [Alicyclobacillus ferrooxydans]|nr:hypothetical protein [Alicyclobacillus ferrooxydans]
MAKSTHRSYRAIPDVWHRCKGLVTLTTVRVVILSYQIDDPKWEYAAVIVNNGSVQAAYVTFDVTDMDRNPLFALKFMQRFECEYPTMEMAKQAITQSQCFKPVSDHDLLERLKIDLIR